MTSGLWRTDLRIRCRPETLATNKKLKKILNKKKRQRTLI